jgi:hypothetical protein
MGLGAGNRARRVSAGRRPTAGLAEQEHLADRAQHYAFLALEEINHLCQCGPPQPGSAEASNDAAPGKVLRERNFVTKSNLVRAQVQSRLGRGRRVKHLTARVVPLRIFTG